MKIAQGVLTHGAFIFHISDQISVKISVLGSCTLTVAPTGVKFGIEEWTKYRPFALRAMLPVKM